MSFFDDSVSVESRVDKFDEEIEEKEFEIFDKEKNNNEKKISQKYIIINDEEESTTIINRNFNTNKKTINIKGEYHSFKLPKFLEVYPDIEKKKKIDIQNNEQNGLSIEKETYDISQVGPNKSAVISWTFDENLYTQIKEKENINKSENNNQECLTDDSELNISDLDEFYEKYNVDNSEIISVSSNDENDKENILLNNLEFLETNSFIVEYKDGKKILFVDNNPYILEEDNDLNYLIECTDENVLLIHGKIGKKLFIKTISKEEQIPPQKFNTPEENIYYSLNENT
ncbi:conserved Plasmodium protein, unknown function [Plasmodium vinckei vinckei]|uniref:Uncharacterized protein n=1 Tax=Plasmodium vinckei vinckei TaxID=54757 RepID=A0A449BYU5_PLAVN|nr:conserved Plasmodium protein, unknown function [Plasmodium vinckei vinckei]VEV58551.1 conserved Plasmodium protein, unknown function [Plasmodium vinckei vinckei]